MNEHVENGQRFLDEGNLDAAAAAFSAALEADASNADARYGLAHVHQALGESDKAIADYRRGLELEPRGAEMAALAELLMNQDGATEAVGLVDQALELEPDHHLAYLLKAELASRDKDFDTADAMLRKGLRRGGDVPVSHVFGLYKQWVQHLLSLDDAARAVEVASRAADTWTDQVHFALLAAGAAEHARDFASALARYQQALESLAPGNLRTEVLEKIAALPGLCVVNAPS